MRQLLDPSKWVCCEAWSLTWKSNLFWSASEESQFNNNVHSIKNLKIEIETKKLKKKIPQVKCPCSHSVKESVVFAHDRLKLWKSDFWTSEVLPHYSFFVFIGEITDFNVIAHFYSLIISALYIFQSIIWSDHIITSLDRSKSQIRRLERVVTSLRSRVFFSAKRLAQQALVVTLHLFINVLKTLMR